VIDIIYRYDPDLKTVDTKPATSAEAKALLENGNEILSHILDPDANGNLPATRIVSVTSGSLGVLGTFEAGVKHLPFAIVVGCADARVPIELIFGQGANDLFVLRVAGNVLGEEILGSVDYALNNLAGSIRLIVVLGHSGCGAVTAATDAFLDPANYLALAAHHHLRSIVNHIFPAVRVAFEALITSHGASSRFKPGFRSALIEMSVSVNAAMVASTLRDQVLNTGVEGVEVVYGIYDIEDRHVGLPIYDSADKRGHILLDPPADGAAYLSQASLLARSPRITRLLEDRAE